MMEANLSSKSKTRIPVLSRSKPQKPELPTDVPDCSASRGTDVSDS